MATNFEMTFARWLFPCWDEPSYKATFNVSITHWADVRVVSNMPELGSVMLNHRNSRLNRRTTTFKTTPKIPIYKLYFMNMNEYYDKQDFENLNFTLWYRSAIKDKTKYAASVGRKALINLGKTVAIKSTLPNFNVILHQGNRMYGKTTDLMGLWYEKRFL